ncbi:MAG: SCP2 sterol-binding domain-containing protein [Clostridia bacterium]|nr:SCP2 sterol-binding domain-containing protein [Clostridia bacterium]MDH7573320.1 SCP2 sterol-binding domain-containing protein [Clostridia bacterium]
MATHEELGECLADFRDRCNADPQLRRLLLDWDRDILVQATDADSSYVLTVRDGTVYLDHRGGEVGRPDVTVSAEIALLVELFSGRITPTEPYLNGTLKVLGTEEDVMRLDFISLMIWGE